MLPLRTTPFAFVVSALFFWVAECKSCAQPVGGLLQETYSVIRSNLGGISSVELDTVAAKALVHALSPRVRWAQQTDVAKTNGPVIAMTALHDGHIGYVRVARVNPDFANEFQKACDELQKTNRLLGLVVDLRYAGGDSYAASAASAGLFITGDKPLIDWGDGMVRSRGKAAIFSFPAALLVNGETEGAAEATAAVFRNSGVGLVIGSQTAGRAGVYREFKLSSGDQLLVASKPIKLGSGAELPLTGLKPDIQVAVAPETEKLFYADAFSTIRMGDAGETNATTMASTNRARRFRVTEADLVRERREGFDPDLMNPSEPDRPVVRDPSLARALDVLKGLAVVRQARPDFRN